MILFKDSLRPSSGTTTSSPDSNSATLHGQRVLVTGAAGFIGSHLTRKLLALGAHVIAVVRPSADLWRIQDVVGEIETIQVDLRRPDISCLQKRLSTIDVIYHLAAAGVAQSDLDSISMMETNILGTLYLLQLARLLESKRFVHCGSCFEYGDGTLLREDTPLTTPVSEYAASKVAASLLVNTFGQRYSLPITILRPFNVYGPFEAVHRLIPHTITNAITNSEVKLTGGEQARDFVFVGDVVEAFVKAAAAPEAVGRTLNVCTGKETSVRDVVNKILYLTGATVVPQFGAMSYRDTEVSNLSGDPTNAKDKLGWRASKSLGEGLRETIQWFQSY